MYWLSTVAGVGNRLSVKSIGSSKKFTVPISDLSESLRTCAKPLESVYTMFEWMISMLAPCMIDSVILSEKTTKES